MKKVEERKKIFVEINHRGQKRNRTIGKREENSSFRRIIFCENYILIVFEINFKVHFSKFIISPI